MKIGTCVLCGKQEEVPDDLDGLLVCESQICVEQAKEIGWNRLLAEFIEAKSVNGQMQFRLRP